MLARSRIFGLLFGALFCFAGMVGLYGGLRAAIFPEMTPAHSLVRRVGEHAADWVLALASPAGFLLLTRSLNDMRRRKDRLAQEKIGDTQR